MPPLIHEALLIGFKEAAKAGLVWLVFYSYLVVNDRKNFVKPFYMGLLVSFLIVFMSQFLPSDIVTKENAGNIISMSFALFLIMSGAALFHVSGTNMLSISASGYGSTLPEETQVPSLKPAAWGIIVLLFTVIFFAPDGMGSLLQLRELSYIKGRGSMSYISALIGVAVVAAVLFTVVGLYKPYKIGGFFDVPQLLLFLAMVKLFGSGAKEFAELSLLPSVQRGFMKFAHDFVHQVFLFLMVPDHPLLKATFWNFIGIFFGPDFASLVSLIILLLFPFMFLYHSLRETLPEPETRSVAEGRKIKAFILSGRRKRALPVACFIVLILIAWFSRSEETIMQMYLPKPIPVVADRGVVMIPVRDPTMNVMDGSLHKFSVSYEGRQYRLILIKKWDNTLAAALDACEMCPPEGYGLRDDHVVCIYCGTPIPVNTLGLPGGCNPIPLAFTIEGGFVKIEIHDIVKKWGFIKPLQGKESMH
ncbi:MAG: DUF2318 domain-containing protein [Nitrospiraceae bacterium]|nr:MAG: DUF2318 domain-containing protein [Nitrospiraceae bacterium]